MAAVKETPIGRYIFYSSKEDAEAGAARLSENKPESHFEVVELAPWCFIPLSDIPPIEGEDDVLDKLMRSTKQKH